MEKDYSTTLNLPETEFPMRGNLPVREPEFLEEMNKKDLYNKLMEKNEGKPLFILHDGPPFANGDIHTGHALNKILKDIVIKHKAMTGYKTPYIPGWDTHGLPIETQAIKKMGVNRFEAGPVKFREVCKDFAEGYIKNHIEQFKRLGVIGDFENPYITYQPEFEARQIELFGEIAKKDIIYKGLKPVYWCPDCQTALAEAEIEYQEDKTYSIYVKFEVCDDVNNILSGIDNAYFVIWTTTTWTLPGNVAICLNADFDYGVYKTEKGNLIVAKEMAQSVFATIGIENYEELKVIKGKDLEGIWCKHPFLDRKSLIINGDHVTLEAGTGCVHTAPGFGMDDFLVCQNYKELPIIVSADDKGCMTDEAGEFAGLKYEEANKKIAIKLDETGHLLKSVKIAHQYPHCWRCKNPIIFRATEQWFASIDAFKDKAIEAIKNVKWVPQWGEERIAGMVKDRADWCISRQRTWGVPIPIFYCEECNKPIINEKTIDAIKELFGKEGSNAWYTLDQDKFLADLGVKCECGCDKFRKETDIMDVWFDSGSSHASVIEEREGVEVSDMYLEGNDQYRGWFQSSLLTSVATKGVAPYKTVLTHGMVVDGEGKKMSKSLGNGIDPIKDICEKMGADILRLWVTSSDYKADIRISYDILKQISEIYRKIRNTARYILGNIHDFNPETDLVEFKDMLEIDRYAIAKLNSVTQKALKAYEDYEYHILYHTIHNFCVVDMSNFYLDIIKDRLYTEKKDSFARRSAQTAMYMVLDSLVKLLAPVLAFTTEEIWANMPHTSKDDSYSVIFNDMPSFKEELNDVSLLEKWERISKLKDAVSKGLEIARTNKVIGHSLGASVTLYADGELLDFIKSIEKDLETVFIVSDVKIKALGEAEDAIDCEDVLGLKVKVSQAEGEKCERCWMIKTSVGENKDHPTLCSRCADALL
ncbi:MAG: isoleucine--tRNA ligase [Ruminococcaceae bacterium]|nr:isoleucine--tRNA ligase [Oscillospiraceae bacterium]